MTSSGLVAIETVKAGDKVWATNPETGETALKEVVQIFRNEASELVHVTVNGEKIVCTNEHPFYVPVKGWTAACQLRAGDRLQLVNGEYTIVEQVQHEILEAPVKVYNFEVEDFHTYYVGEESVLVHNKCGSGSYEIFTTDDRVYVGKGGEARMKASMKRLEKLGYTIQDKLWTPAANSKIGFIDEYMKMAKYDFDFGGKLINKIMSPGAKLFELWL